METRHVTLLDEHWRRLQIRVGLDLADHEIRDVCSRNEPVSPGRFVSEHAVSARLGRAGQNPRSRNDPIEIAALDDLLLHVLVRVGSPKNALEHDALQTTDGRATVACAIAGDADQAVNSTLCHRIDDDTRSVGEQAYRGEQCLGRRRDPQREYDRVDASESRAHVPRVGCVSINPLEPRVRD